MGQVFRVGDSVTWKICFSFSEALEIYNTFKTFGFIISDAITDKIILK